MWFRFFGCNLQCSGFGQKDPTDPSTYDLPYKDFDVSSIDHIEALPVWTRGCDSSYSWSSKFKHLNYQDTARDIAVKVTELLKSDDNPLGTFYHDTAQMDTHMCFTGGEPLLPANQRSTIAIMNEFDKMPGGIMQGCIIRRSSNMPRYMTFETNGTQKLTPEMITFLKTYSNSLRVIFSVSPKLFTVSGETHKKAIRPEVVRSYMTNVSCKGQLKFVLGNDDEQWEELDIVVRMFRAAGVDWPIYIMPVGATEEAQQDIAAQVSDRALSRGYHVSARVHTYIYGNKLGT